MITNEGFGATRRTLHHFDLCLDEMRCQNAVRERLEIRGNPVADDKAAVAMRHDPKALVHIDQQNGIRRIGFRLWRRCAKNNSCGINYAASTCLMRLRLNRTA
jgi:hypothetical protein